MIVVVISGCRIDDAFDLRDLCLPSAHLTVLDDGPDGGRSSGGGGGGGGAVVGGCCCCGSMHCLGSVEHVFEGLDVIDGVSQDLYFGESLCGVGTGPRLQGFEGFVDLTKTPSLSQSGCFPAIDGSRLPLAGLARPDEAVAVGLVATSGCKDVRRIVHFRSEYGVVAVATRFLLLTQRPAGTGLSGGASTQPNPGLLRSIVSHRFPAVGRPVIQVRLDLSWTWVDH